MADAHRVWRVTLDNREFLFELHSDDTTLAVTELLPDGTMKEIDDIEEGRQIKDVFLGFEGTLLIISETEGRYLKPGITPDDVEELIKCKAGSI